MYLEWKPLKILSYFQIKKQTRYGIDIKYKLMAFEEHDMHVIEYDWRIMYIFPYRVIWLRVSFSLMSLRSSYGWVMEEVQN